MIEDKEVWTAYAFDRVWVCRISVATSGLNVIASMIAAIVMGAAFDVWHAVIVLFIFLAALWSEKIRNNPYFVSTMVIVWTGLNIATAMAVVVFIWNDGKSFWYPLGLEKGNTNVSAVLVRLEPIPFISVLIQAAMGVSMRVWMPCGLIIFLCEAIVCVAVVSENIVDVAFQDYINIISNKIFHAALTLYFAWTAETHQHKARDSLVLLKHSLRQWINQRETDRITRTRIVGYIFHEVRNPLNNIMLAADLLLDRVHHSHSAANTTITREDWSEMAELLDTISKAADSACHVLNDALSLQRLEAGTFEFVKQPFSITRLHIQALRVAGPQMLQKHITLTYDIDPTLDNLNVYGDFNRLQQVLTNFFSNAYKFTPSHGTVHLSAVKVKDEEVVAGQRFVTVRTSVRDSGLGIAQEDHERVFQAWSQIRASDLQQGQGSGLGLSLCKAFVEVGHGGRIGFISDAGKGTCFYFEIDFHVSDGSPSQPQHLQSASAQINHSTPPGSIQQSTAHMISSEGLLADRSDGDNFAVKREEINLRVLRSTTNDDADTRVESSLDTGTTQMAEPESLVKDVLIVDDSLVTRKLLTKILSLLNVTFDSCENGQEAVDKVLKGHCMFRLIIMDKEMPVMDGFVATRTLRRAHYDGPIVGLTGNAMDGQVTDFLAAGVNDVVSKPIKRETLMRILAQFGIAPAETEQDLGGDKDVNKIIAVLQQQSNTPPPPPQHHQLQQHQCDEQLHHEQPQQQQQQQQQQQ